MENNDGYQELMCWFGLSYASFLVLPRVLMQEMPNEWQLKMVKLLEEYDQTFDTSTVCEGTRVQALDKSGKLSRFPNEMLNYRRPSKEFIERVKIK